jgi:L-histidine N-alpha-methyltransferase
LRVHGVAGDFERHLEGVPARPWSGRRIVAFLGGTIGNLHPDARAPFLRAVARLLGPNDRLVVGTDLAGDPGRLEPAYDDAAGVTAAFNLNLLRVLNHELDGDFDLAGFAHVAVYREDPAWIEMRLRARRRQRVHLRALDLEVRFAQGEEVLTELSCKFTRDTVRAMYESAGLELAEWHTDPGERFAVSVAALAQEDSPASS